MSSLFASYAKLRFPEVAHLAKPVKTWTNEDVRSYAANIGLPAEVDQQLACSRVTGESLSHCLGCCTVCAWMMEC